MRRWLWSGAMALLCSLAFSGRAAADNDPLSVDPAQLAAQVVVYRDPYGVPHIDAKNDEAAMFAFAYCQAEDYLWQIEDSYVMGLGRFAELYGKKVLEKDITNRAFEIPQRSQADFKQLDAKSQRYCVAFTAGLNYYLAKHPQVKLRLLERFEPWYMLAFGRAAMIELGGGHLHTSREVPESYADATERQLQSELKVAIGSNAWAIGPQKTKDGHAMLFVNPHQPYYGFGQFYEGHIRSGDGWNFIGATFFGSPVPTLGHNEHCGWAFTVNEPDIGSAWIETFDDPKEPLNYRYGDGYRKAVEWTDTIKVKKGRGFEEVKRTFRKTHHGPILRRHGQNQFVAAMLGKLYDALLSRQSIEMLKAKNLQDFRRAMNMIELPIFNTVYADVEGNIYYVYNGIIPRRDPSFDWSKPVDGSDPRTEWQGYHSLDDLPQMLNPPSGYIQSCNSTPFTTSDDGNPAMGDFPEYMVTDKHDDKRRAKVSRYLLRDVQNATFDDWLKLIFDTTIYWARTELPVYGRKLETLKETNPDLAAKAEPYLKHLLDWDGRGDITSTQTTLCMAWYEELYGFGYPAETLKREFVGNPAGQFEALITAARKLQDTFGDWKVAWGDVNRLQRHANVSDFFLIPFSDNLPSIPSAGLHGPPGVAFTMYFTPTVYVPPLKIMKKHYAVVGTSYISAVEFAPKVKSQTLVQYGVSSDPKSPHFFDQAKLLSERKLKPSYFDWEEAKAHAERTYHPGEEVNLETAGK
ncbi:MAG: penicillin acylase family protein [Pirellulales bacterium]|nr:penicillin acylase family protein [Pirellulales bacterium]